MLHKKQPDRTQSDQIGFVGRAEAKQRFTGLLSERQPTALPLIMYHGADGNGKTSLLMEMQKFCALPEISVPCISLNFEDSPVEGSRITSVHAAVIRLAEQAKKSRTKGVRLKKVEQILADARKLSAYRASVDSQEGIVLAYGGGQLIDAVMKGGVEGILVSGVGFVIYNHKVIVNTFRNLVEDLRGNHDPTGIQSLSPEEVQDALDKDYATRLAASFDDRPERFVRAVLFFDAYEAAVSDKATGWLRGLHHALRGHGVLFVVAGQRRLSGWQDDAENVPVYGFTEDEASAYLDAAGVALKGRFGLADQMPASLKREISAECLHHSERGTDYYSPALLEGYTDILRIELEKGPPGRGSGYPGSLHLETTGAGKNHVGRLLERTFRVIPETHQGVRPWLCELALGPTFDERFADAVNFRRDSRHSNAPSIDWAYLSELSILNRQEVTQGRKNHTFYSLPRAYKRELIKDITPEYVQATHRVGVEHWLERAEGRLSESEYDLYTMEQPYWQRMMSNCLSHLHALKEPVTPKTLLLITKLLLDFYWWWCENLPHAAWHAMVDRAVALTREEHGEVGEVLELLKRFDAAWPKRWQLNPLDWKPEAERSEEEKGWDYSKVLASMQSLRVLLDTGSEGLRDDTDASRLYQYIGAMLSYYEGIAHHYRALASPDVEPASTFEQAEEALKTYGAWFAGFRPKGHGSLKHAWSLITLADLHISAEDHVSATSDATEALRILPEPGKQTGVHREGSSGAYHALSVVALRKRKWKMGGRKMGLALAFSYGFYAMDQDDYAYEYYFCQQQSARNHLHRIYEYSPDGAHDYLRGVYKVWAKDGAVPTSNTSVDTLLASLDQTFLSRLGARPHDLRTEDFMKAEGRFKDLLSSAKPELALRA